MLVNRHSASAAEIVAACLQDSGRAVVVGERSFGKGSVQNILPLEDGASYLKLTVETYFRPSGKNIHKFPDAKPEDEWGVSPDEGLAVELSDEEYIAWEQFRREQDANSRIALPREDRGDAGETPKDQQLARALEVVNAAIADGAKTARN